MTNRSKYYIVFVIMKLGKKELEKKLSIFKDICYREGLKITPQRLAIYKELISSFEHPSASNLYEKVKKYFSNISLDTVNRTLLTFNRIGIIRVVEGSGNSKRYDSKLEPHHHFRCVRCNRIIDFYNKEYDDIEIPAEFKAKFIVTTKRINLEGVCNKCRVQVK